MFRKFITVVSITGLLLVGCAYEGESPISSSYSIDVPTPTNSAAKTEESIDTILTELDVHIDNATELKELLSDNPEELQKLLVDLENYYVEPAELPEIPCDISSSDGLLHNVKQITTGDVHTCALLEDSTVACWGTDLITGNTKTKATCVDGLSNVVAIDSGGGEDTCAVLSNGTVKCIDGSTGEVKKIKGIVNAVSISNGNSGDHCILNSDGDVNCFWGTFQPSEKTISIPKYIKLIDNTTEITYDNITIVHDYVTIKAFENLNINKIENNGKGMLCGDSSNQIYCLFYGGAIQYNSELKATLMEEFYNKDDVYSKSFDMQANSFLCILDKSLSNKKVFCAKNSYVLWEVKGADDYGLYDAKKIHVSTHMHCIITNNDVVKCAKLEPWLYKSNFNVIENLNNFEEISLGGSRTPIWASQHSHGCALISDGTVRCWGNNDYYQLGNGSTLTSNSAVNVLAN